MPGLSILIPVYNRDVRELVQAVQTQAVDWQGLVEIICLDDGSDREFRMMNRALASLPGVQYEELPQNIGRAAIRNRLATRAQHPWLLLLDNNVRLPDGFLARYAAALDQAPVLVGGALYERFAPTQLPYVLRWKYGSSREARTAASRQQTAYANFNLKNVLLRADILRQIPLDERLTGYGHEDTRFGWDLKAAGIVVQHLDNPVLHSFLETADSFLQKTHEGIRNLAWLYHHEGLGTETRVLRAALMLRRWRLSKIAHSVLQGQEPRMRQNLLSPMPSLRQFDLLKLYWLLTELTLLDGQG